MYNEDNRRNTFVIQNKKRWGNTVCYGAVFSCQDFYYYSYLLDAFHGNSLSSLKSNHPNDLNFRVLSPITPIYFSSIEELSRLQYKEGKPVNIFTYLANPSHPKIKSRFKPELQFRHRIQDGIDKKNFIALFNKVSSKNI